MNGTTLIFIRHASVVKKGIPDTLTSLGQQHANDLSELLREEYNVDHLFYVNQDRRKRPVTRCYETVKNMGCELIPCKWNGFPLEDLSQYNGKTIGICYIKQSLQHFTMIPCDRFSDRNDKDKTDLLYENIVVINCHQDEYEFVSEIPTQDKSEEKQMNDINA